MLYSSTNITEDYLRRIFTAAAYDVTRRETFDSITDIWMKEVDMYSTVNGAVKAVIGNKLDLVRHHVCLLCKA